MAFNWTRALGAGLKETAVQGQQYLDRESKLEEKQLEEAAWNRKQEAHLLRQKSLAKFRGDIEMGAAETERGWGREDVTAAETREEKKYQRRRGEEETTYGRRVATEEKTYKRRLAEKEQGGDSLKQRELYNETYSDYIKSIATDMEPTVEQKAEARDYAKRISGYDPFPVEKITLEDVKKQLGVAKTGEEAENLYAQIKSQLSGADQQKIKTEIDRLFPPKKARKKVSDLGLLGGAAELRKRKAKPGVLRKTAKAVAGAPKYLADTKQLERQLYAFDLEIKRGTTDVRKKEIAAELTNIYDSIPKYYQALAREILSQVEPEILATP